MTKVLTYSRAPRTMRWGIRAAFCMIALAVAAIACAKWQPLRWRIEQAHYLWLQSQAMRHSSPPEQVAFESDPKRAAALLSSHPRLYSQPSPIPWETVERKAMFEKAWEPVAFYNSPILPRIWPKRGQANGVLFLHRRRNPAGQERLAIVGIEMQGVRSPGDDWLVLRGYVCRPASFQPGSRLAVPTPAFISPRIRVERQHEPVRFYVGQPDPDDPTHLTIGVEAQGQRSVIDGWLRMPYARYPAEHIELKLRNPGRFTIDGL